MSQWFLRLVWKNMAVITRWSYKRGGRKGAFHCTKSIQQQIKSIDVDKVGSKKPLISELIMFLVELITSAFLDLISKRARWNAAVSAFSLLPTLSTSILFICFWIDLVRVLATTGNNVCGRRLYACINTRKFKGLDSREITSLPEIKKVIYIAHHLNHRRK